MLFIVAALAFMGIVMGAAAHTPLPVFLAASTAIGAWLLVFFIREHLRHRRADRHGHDHPPGPHRHPDPGARRGRPEATGRGADKPATGTPATRAAATRTAWPSPRSSSA
ncbi:hypothetical protein NKH77_32360 [Streptomyces sp. M19]